MVKKNHVQKKATAEVLVFEQNMLKKNGHTAMVLFRKKNMSKEQTTIPETCLFGTLAQKNAPKQKAATPLCFSFPSKTCQNKKRTRRHRSAELTHFLIQVLQVGQD
jgi:adenylate kinase family enzyme